MPYAYYSRYACIVLVSAPVLTDISSREILRYILMYVILQIRS